MHSNKRNAAKHDALKMCACAPQPVYGHIAQVNGIFDDGCRE